MTVRLEPVEEFLVKDEKSSGVVFKRLETMSKPIKFSHCGKRHYSEVPSSSQNLTHPPLLLITINITTLFVFLPSSLKEKKILHFES
ncbi:hypothetical protein EYC84_010243 [Monilinia fructicola]|uniref:Uncharacterized protein n=1 Tax=Monilinia fructicola TaxID=38448 RepID=A0A5M9JC51_MONFR|nr:hypothetical protein EYC84_010243 [Monilinia fructicola]